MMGLFSGYWYSTCEQEQVHAHQCPCEEDHKHRDVEYVRVMRNSFTLMKQVVTSPEEPVGRPLILCALPDQSLPV